MRNSLRGRYLLIGTLTVIAVGLVVQMGQRQSAHMQADATAIIDDYYGYHNLVEALKTAADQADHEILSTGNGGPSAQTIATLKERAGQLWEARNLCENDYFSGLCDALDVQLTKLVSDVSPNAKEKSVKAIGKLAHIFERRSYDAVVGSIFSALNTSRDMSQFLWWVASICVVVVLIGYVTFELSIYRPLRLIAGAMEAEGQGHAPHAALPDKGADELILLVKAFEGMRAQVRARQSRLQSVLDGTNDGIITVSGDGTIESMNRAARIILGSEGRDVGKTINDAFGESLWPLDGVGECIVNLDQPDGTVHQFSLKCAEFQIGGQRRFNVMVADVTERRIMIDKLTTAAERDALTGLYNRRYFFQELERACSRAERQEKPSIAFLSIDLDHFKFINDTFGHQAGDALLIEISRKLSEHSRRGDLLARLGGDEFAVLLFDVDAGSTEAIAESFRSRIADHPFHCSGSIIRVGCSLGIAMLSPTVRKMEDLVARADMSCRCAKQRGRNCYHVFQEQDLDNFERLTADMNVTERVRRAIDENLLRLAFQPIVDFNSRAVIGYEVLSRLQETSGGMLQSAGPFIAEAERVGRACDIDYWVIETLFSAIAKGEIPNSVAMFSVNLSGQTIATPNFSENVVLFLEKYGIDPCRLVFEVTETALISNTAQVCQVLEDLRRLGARTALDDFGSGYCSFLYLRELPVDIVKLDGSLVRKICDNQVDLAIVKSMYEVARALHKQTIAEFVENSAIEKKLREIGITLGQGFYFGDAQAGADQFLLCGEMSEGVIPVQDVDETFS